jgi:uncharacterized protein (DUF1330 family)
MPALIIFGVTDVTDSDILDAYAAAGAASLGDHPFDFVAGPEPGELLEGETDFAKFVVLRFPSREAAGAWYRSPAYQDAIAMRKPVSKTFAMLIDVNE